MNMLEKISKLMFYGFYDPSKDLVTVHFFNDKENKPDIIAFLKHDMSWDVREIINETSVLNDDGETVTILHKKLALCKPDSNFDKFVRKGLFEMAKQAEEKDSNLIKNDKMLEILKSNSYPN